MQDPESLHFWTLCSFEVYYDWKIAGLKQKKKTFNLLERRVHSSCSGLKLYLLPFLRHSQQLCALKWASVSVYSDLLLLFTSLNDTDQHTGRCRCTNPFCFPLTN